MYSLDGQFADLGPDRNPHLYTEHGEVFRTDGPRSVWEMAITGFTSVYEDALGVDSPRVELREEERIGHLVACCNSYQSGTREHF